MIHAVASARRSAAAVSSAAGAGHSRSTHRLAACAAECSATMPGRPWANPNWATPCAPLPAAAAAAPPFDAVRPGAAQGRDPGRQPDSIHHPPEPQIFPPTPNARDSPTWHPPYSQSDTPPRPAGRKSQTKKAARRPSPKDSRPATRARIRESRSNPAARCRGSRSEPAARGRDSMAARQRSFHRRHFAKQHAQCEQRLQQHRRERKIQPQRKLRRA